MLNFTYTLRSTFVCTDNFDKGCKGVKLDLLYYWEGKYARWQALHEGFILIEDRRQGGSERKKKGTRKKGRKEELSHSK